MSPARHIHAPTLLAPGTRVDGYRIENVLGHGGMGVVYEATQVSLNRVIALKLLAPHLSDDPVFHERFRREGLLQAALDHPNIVTVHEAGESDFGLFLAMRLVRGPRLKDLIVARDVDARRSLALLEPIADALDTAHGMGLVHRDVKPQNILIGARDHPYLADFGLTKLTGEHSLTGSGQFVGTLDYISPEQIVGERPTGRSDVYALGAVLYECLEGRVPFCGESQAAVLYGHLSEPPPRLSERQPELPAALDDVILRALAKDPSERYGSASELIRSARVAFGDTVPAIAPLPRPKAAPEESTRFARDLTRLAWSGGAIRTHTQPEAPTEALPQPVRGRPRLPRAFVAVALAALAAAAVVGASAGGSGATPTAASGASQGSLALTWPAGWTRASSSGPVQGFDFSEPVELTAPGTGGQDGVVAGEVQTAGPLLLPDKFLKLLPHPPPPPARVDLGSIEALRYANLSPRGSHRRMTVYAVLTNRGIATTVCFAIAASAATFLPRCERVAATLRVSGASTHPIAPDGAYAKSLSSLVETLSLARGQARADLRSARSPNDQARAAVALARAYARSARELGSITPPGAVERFHVPFSLAVAQAEAAYADMAIAVAQNDSGAYHRAAGNVATAEREIEALLPTLRALGYHLA